MKSLFVLLLFCITYSTLQAQFSCSFDNPASFSCQKLSIDTLSNPNNIWQIGAPQKVVLDTAYSYTNVIITDTVSPYPVNDTSYFMIKYAAQGGLGWGHTSEIGFNYWVDSDTLNDFGTIEFSPDNGQTWVDLINDTTYMDTNHWYLSTPPSLTGRSSGWVYTSCNTNHLGFDFDIDYGDTVIYRFGFTSDGSSDTLGGLMYDNINILDWFEGLPKYSKSEFNSIAFPNPTGDKVTISFGNQNSEEMICKVYDQKGNIIMTSKPTRNNKIHFDFTGVSKGNYHYLLRKPNGKVSSGKVVKN